MGGGKGGGYRPPAPPPKPVGQAQIKGSDIVENDDGTFTYGDYTGTSRRGVIANATRGIVSEQRREADERRLLSRLMLGIRSSGGTSYGPGQRPRNDHSSWGAPKTSPRPRSNPRR